jgi:hypothetical protein
MKVVIRVDTPDYQVEGYALVRGENSLFNIVDIRHCSCNQTDYDEEDECNLTLNQVIELAVRKVEPRLPDVVTDDIHLLELYKLVLEHQTEINLMPDFSLFEFRYNGKWVVDDQEVVSS